MKVGLYLQNGGEGIGGSEYWLACLAEELSNGHDVTILHHKVGLTRARLSAFSGMDLSRIHSCECLPGPRSQWHDDDASVTSRSEQFDLFVTITHFVPPVCRATLGVLIVLFPLEPAPNGKLWPWSEALNSSSWLRGSVRRAYYSSRWQDRFRGYQVRTSLSLFARDWVRRSWNIDTTVLYPPSDTAFESMPKFDQISSVGRFVTRGATSKCQLELARLFRSAVAPHASAWSYSSIGPIGSGHGDKDYFERVKQEASGQRIQIIEGADRSTLKTTLARTKIFWHGVGIDIDEETAPHRCEHFGLVTVEAMAAGAVPVVIGRGGQREIVRHGVDGFLCETIDEMAKHTLALIDNPDQLASMSAESRLRSQCFSIKRSIESLWTLVRARPELTLE
jgi:L-malate glycosyltransferase